MKILSIELRSLANAYHMQPGHPAYWMGQCIGIVVDAKYDHATGVAKLKVKMNKGLDYVIDDMKRYPKDFVLSVAVEEVDDYVGPV